MRKARGFRAHLVLSAGGIKCLSYAGALSVPAGLEQAIKEICQVVKKVIGGAAGGERHPPGGIS